MTVEWIRYWPKEDLFKIVDLYFKDCDDPVIAISNTFDENNTDLAYLKDVFLYAKNKFSNVKIIHGSNRALTENYEHVDVEFIGRSLAMFDDWMHGKDLSKYITRTDPLVLINYDFNQFIDNPIIHTLYDDDCLDSNDVLGFEIGVGCKFNCAFCSYELRNSKIVNLNDYKRLHNFFDEAYNKFGVSNFYCIDDTINESDEKLSILAEAVSNLNYKPNISAYARLDLLQKKYQRELFKKIDFDSIFFGIESFNPNVSKITRKKTSMESVYNSLEFMRDECPNTFTMGSLIMGLVGDTFESIDMSLEKVANEKLLDALQIYTLTLNTGKYTDPYLLSEIQKYPEKYGYKIYNAGNNAQIANSFVQWENNWTNNVEANKMVTILRNKYKNNFIFANHSEISSFKQMKILKDKKIMSTDSLRSRAIPISHMYKEKYIRNKKQILGI